MRVALAVAAAAVCCGMSISVDTGVTDSVLAAAQVPGVEAFSVDELQPKITVEPDLSGLDRGFILKRLFDVIAKDAKDNTDAVVRVAAWVQKYFVHPKHTPLRADGAGVYDPVQLLLLRRAQCGQVNRVMLDILAAGGYRGRVVQLNQHQGAEVYYEGDWHYIEADALDMGFQFRDTRGDIPSAEEIFKDTSIVEGACFSCEALKMYNRIKDEDWPDYQRANPHYTGGERWRMVFTDAPVYYEKTGGTDDPEYGWLDYKTYR